MADPFDFDFDSDIDDNDTIIIETKDEIINFDNGFYTEDKTANIMNFLSNNDSDFIKFKKYWNNKINNILDIKPIIEIKQYNQNRFPVVSLTKKATFGKDCAFNDMYESQLVEEYIKERKQIVFFYNSRGKIVQPYTKNSDNRQYILLNPYVTAQHAPIVDSDQDVFSKNDERVRLLKDIDRLDIIGYVNLPGLVKPETEISMNIDDYIKSIEQLKQNDNVEIHVVNGVIYSGTCIKNNLNQRIMTIQFNKQKKTFNYKDFNDPYLIWPIDEPIKFGKNKFQNTLVTILYKDGKYKYESEQFLSLSAIDIIIMSSVVPVTLDNFRETYNGILETNDNAQISKMFKIFKGILKDKKTVLKNHNKKLKFQDKNDINDVVTNIYKWIKSSPKSHGPSQTSINKENKTSSKPYGKIFFSVEEMYHDKQTHDNNANATLIVSKNTFYNKQNKDMFLLNPTCFKLHIVNGKWDIEKEITIKYIQTYFDQGEYTFPTTDFFENYKISKIHYTNQSKRDFRYSTYKSYENYQGIENDLENDVVEFGVIMDTLKDEDEDDENILQFDSNTYTYNEKIIKDLADIFGIKLSLSKITYIANVYPLSEDESKSSKLVKTFLTYTSLFIIFIQIALPENISNFNVKHIESMLLNPDESNELIRDFIMLASNAKHLDPFSTKWMVIQNNLNSQQIKASIHFLLKQIPILNVYLKARAKSLDKIEIHKSNYPLWDTFRPSEKKLTSKRLTSKQCININPIIIQKEIKNLAIKKDEKIIRKHNKILTLDVKEIKTNIEQKGVFSIDQNLTFLFDINSNSKSKDKSYNNVSKLNDAKILKTKPALRQKINQLLQKSFNTNIFASFLKYQLKGLIGKIIYNYQVKFEGEINPKNYLYWTNFVQMFHEKLPTIKDNLIECMIDIQNNILNNIDFIDDSLFDSKYIYIYLLLTIFEKINDETLSLEILSLIDRHIDINMMTTDQVKIAQQKERENKKKQLQNRYKEIEDKDLRRLLKQVVDIGLISKEEFAKEIDVEEVQSRLNNDKDDYDRDAEE